jgi:hypothetical protein
MEAQRRFLPYDPPSNCKRSPSGIPGAESRNARISRPGSVNGRSAIALRAVAACLLATRAPDLETIQPRALLNGSTEPVCRALV